MSDFFGVNPGECREGESYQGCGWSNKYFGAAECQRENEAQGTRRTVRGEREYDNGFSCGNK